MSANDDVVVKVGIFKSRTLLNLLNIYIFVYRFSEDCLCAFPNLSTQHLHYYWTYIHHDIYKSKKKSINS